MATDRPRTGSFSWSASFREAGLLLLVAVILTAASWSLRPEKLPLQADPLTYELELAAPLIDPSDALLLYDEGIHLFIDSRPRPAGAFDTVPGAIFISEENFDDDLLEYFDFMTPEDYLILFGDGDLFSVSNLAVRFQERGYENLLILKGGLGAWRKAGGEISHRTGGES